MMEREANPTTLSLAKFCTSSVALFVKLPLETVLRRGQVAVLSTPAYVRAVEQPATAKGQGKDDNTERRQATAPTTMETIVRPGKFNGVLGTMYSIVTEEGSRPPEGKAKRQDFPRREERQKQGRSDLAAEGPGHGRSLEGVEGQLVGDWWGSGQPPSWAVGATASSRPVCLL